MITGARRGTLSGLRRLAAVAMARDLGAFLIPGPEIARAHGLDIEAAGMKIVATPRHAGVLVVVGAIPPALREAGAVIYAQMMRPRALFALGAEELSPLPAADVVAGLSRRDLIAGVRRLRAAFAEGAFRPAVSDFDAPMLHVRIEYTCPMHPDVVRNEQGSCPKCGMTLVPREAQASAGGAHTDHQEMADAEMPAVSTHDHGGHHDVGMIAEEVGAVLPEIVNYEENGTDAVGMDYSKLTPLLVEAVNALRAEKDAQIEALRKGNAAIVARLQAMESMLAELAGRETGGAR